MLGELPLASRRNLFGLWNQIFPELMIGLFSILTFFSSGNQPGPAARAPVFANATEEGFQIGGQAARPEEEG